MGVVRWRKVPDFSLVGRKRKRNDYVITVFKSTRALFYCSDGENCLMEEIDCFGCVLNSSDFSLFQDHLLSADKRRE